MNPVQTAAPQASAEFVRLLRERNGVLTSMDKQYVIGLYVTRGVDQARVEAWLEYTLNRMPRNKFEARSVPNVEMPEVPELPDLVMPSHSGVIAMLASKLPRVGAPPPALLPEHITPPAL